MLTQLQLYSVLYIMCSEECLNFSQKVCQVSVSPDIYVVQVEVHGRLVSIVTLTLPSAKNALQMC